jgi:hypothetical protein
VTPAREREMRAMVEGVHARLAMAERALITIAFRLADAGVPGAPIGAEEAAGLLGLARGTLEQINAAAVRAG